MKLKEYQNVIYEVLICLL